jgi:hypothetical protein
MGERRVGGILVPYNVRDKKRTWWNERSEFALRMFAPHPLFAVHSLAERLWGRAGTLDLGSFKSLPEGLYVEADVDEGPSGDYILELALSGDGAWSSGTMPHLVKMDGGMYVSRWPIVEGSVLHWGLAGSWRGTSVAHVRALVTEPILEDDGVVLERSIWVMPENQGQGTGHQSGSLGAGAPGHQPEHASGNAPGHSGNPQPAPVITPVAGNGDLAAIRQEIAAIREVVQNPAMRAVPAGSMLPVANIQVSSQWDDIGLLPMLLRDQHMRFAAPFMGRPFARDEEFMRALVEKAGQIYGAQEKAGVMGGDYMRAIDAVSYDMMHRKVPYLRANEVMQATLAGSGDEWVPTLLSSVAYHAFRLESKVLGLFPSFQMPSNPFDFPTLDTGLNLRRRVLETTDRAQMSIPTSTFPDSKPTTGKITFTAGKIGGLSMMSREWFEDGGLSVANEMATAFARAGGATIDDVLLNGDEQTGATNISHYGAAPTGTPYDGYLVLDGLRKIAVGNSDSADETDATLDADSIIQGMKLMGARGRLAVDKTKLAVICDPGVHWKMLPLTNFVTMDKVGTLASILTGMVGVWYGVSTVISDQLEYLTSSENRMPSTHDGVDGQFLIVNRDLIKIGYRRQVEVEQGPIQHTEGYVMSWSVRLDIQAMEAGAVADIVDITV